MQVISCSILLILMLKNLKVIITRHTVALYSFKNNDFKLNYMPGREI